MKRISVCRIARALFNSDRYITEGNYALAETRGNCNIKPVITFGDESASQPLVTCRSQSKRKNDRTGARIIPTVPIHKELILQLFRSVTLG